VNIGWAADQLRRGKRVRRRAWQHLALELRGAAVVVVDGHGNAAAEATFRSPDLLATDWVVAR
jgi:hypothetical protein